jgi:hypothetical protein
MITEFRKLSKLTIQNDEELYEFLANDHTQSGRSSFDNGRQENMFK